MAYGTNEYKASTTLVKAALDFLRTLGIGGAVIAGFIATLPEPPQDWESFKSTWPLFLVAVATSLFRAYNNWRKNANGGSVLPFLIVGFLAASVMAGCITTTTTLPDGSVTVTREIDMEALATLPGLIGDLGVELARIEAALDDVDETAPPTADELAMRARRQEILDRLLEAGIEVIQNADTAKG